MIGSGVVTIFVGTESQSSISHKDLLSLHSNHFRTKFVEANEDTKFKLEDIGAVHFAKFNAWLYSGGELQLGKGVAGFASRWEGLWMLGQHMEAPAFQNYCMDGIRNSYKARANERLKAPTLGFVYKVTKQGSLLRKFFSDLMSCKNPFQGLEEGSEIWAEWDALLKRAPDLSNDITKAAGKQWGRTRAWDDVHRDSYMVKEVPLAKAWMDQILVKRTKEEIEEAAKGKDARSILEFAHLKRNEAPTIELDD